MRTMKVLQTLVLLACALMTAPTGSMAQDGLPEAGTAVSVPHAGPRTAAMSVRQSADPGDSLSTRDCTLPPFIFSKVPAAVTTRVRTRSSLSPDIPLTAGRTPTYQANAPPLLG